MSQATDFAGYPGTPFDLILISLIPARPVGPPGQHARSARTAAPHSPPAQPARVRGPRLKDRSADRCLALQLAAIFFLQPAPGPLRIARPCPGAAAPSKPALDLGRPLRNAGEHDGAAGLPVR